MAKIEKRMLRGGNMLNPAPVVMVTCGSTLDEYNIITIAWTGTVNSDPPMCSISVRPERHSYDIIKREGEFVINLVDRKLAPFADWCGVRSGKKYNKFIETVETFKKDLTAVPEAKTVAELNALETKCVRELQLMIVQVEMCGRDLKALRDKRDLELRK